MTTQNTPAPDESQLDASLTQRMRRALAQANDPSLLNDINAQIEKKQWARIDELRAEIDKLKKEADERLTQTWVEEHLTAKIAPLKVDMAWEKWLSRGIAAGVGATLVAIAEYLIEHH